MQLRRSVQLAPPTRSFCVNTPSDFGASASIHSLEYFSRSLVSPSSKPNRSISLTHSSVSYIYLRNVLAQFALDRIKSDRIVSYRIGSNRRGLSARRSRRAQTQSSFATRMGPAAANANETPAQSHAMEPNPIPATLLPATAASYSRRLEHRCEPIQFRRRRQLVAIARRISQRRLTFRLQRIHSAATKRKCLPPRLCCVHDCDS